MSAEQKLEKAATNYAKDDWILEKLDSKRRKFFEKKKQNYFSLQLLQNDLNCFQ